MIIDGLEMGVSHDIIRLKEGFAMASPGSATQYSFDDFSCFGPNGTRLGVLALVVKIRDSSYSVPTVVSSYLDGVSVAQLFSKIAIKLADGSPPSKFDGGDMLINSMDNYRALQALSFLSHKPVVWAGGQGNERVDFSAVPTAIVQPDSVLAPSSFTRTRGWLQNQGPFMSTGAVASTFNKEVMFIYPIGCQAGEPHGSCAIPANWLTGERQGCEKSGNGYIEMTLGQTMDNQAITWVSNPVVDLYAIVCRYNLGDQPIPTTPKIRNFKTNEQSFKSPSRGVRKGLMFMPPLDAAGAMQNFSYERVEQYVNGSIYLESQINLNFLSQSYFGNYNDDRYWDVPLTNATLTARQATRRVNAFMPLQLYPDSNLHGVGNLYENTLIKVVTAITTEHNLVDISLTPITAEVRAEAANWATGDQLTVSSSTSNGNQPTIASGKSMAIPAVAEIPQTQLLSMKAGG